jgi:hypothetical protein
MARFDRQDEEAKASKSLDLATENLETFVVDKVREILDEAVSKAEQIEREAAERAERLIRVLENSVGAMVSALRTEMEGFAADLGSRNGSRTPQAGNDHGEVEQMIIEQVAVLRRQGRPRAEAERLVMRFKQGHEYMHVIDRIYTET